MYRSVYDFKAFYNGKVGRVFRRVVQARIREIWPDVKGLRVMGCGYAVPYLRSFKDDQPERVFAVMPAGREWETCVHDWPQDAPNAAVLAESGELPFETNSIDRVLMIHDIEFSEALKPALQEIWRVLKSQGRLMVVVPNRAGLWARADWSPFGQGTPYSLTQIEYHLRDNLFVHERTEGALFMLPLKAHLNLKSAGVMEKVGRVLFPFMAGAYIVEVSKQIYATTDRGYGARVPARTRRALVPSMRKAEVSQKNT